MHVQASPETAPVLIRCVQRIVRHALPLKQRKLTGVLCLVGAELVGSGLALCIADLTHTRRT